MKLESKKKKKLIQDNIIFFYERPRARKDAFDSGLRMAAVSSIDLETLPSYANLITDFRVLL